MRESMPYRDPAQKAAWMREYRKRKRLGKTGAPPSLPSAPSVARPPEPPRVSVKTIDGASAQPSHPTTGLVPKAARTRLKTALDLARTFPFGSSPPGYACIAITPATVRPAHGAAIVSEPKDEVPHRADGRCGPNGRPSNHHCTPGPRSFREPRTLPA